MPAAKYEYWLTDEGLTLLNAWARDGLIDDDIAKKIGISRSTLTLWKKQYSVISVALKKGKEIVDIEVENKLYENAIGAYYEEEQAFKLKTIYYDENDRRCENERIEIVLLKKQRPPDITSIIYWLKNRKPVEWRDRPAIDVNINTVEDLRPLAELLK